ncbi:MAG: UDP-N-acetylenolpyruvoylglucosamine reductase [Oligoflexia bacterium]|nr:MAG: UDP-N-acetylenolpyruvoylglucosamine reductase [Oligoflexia bacterium]
MVKIQENIILAPMTSWLVGGPAEFFCLPEKVEEIQEAQSWAQIKGLPVQVLGGGTNVLISDQGIRGLTICLKNFSGLKAQETHERLTIEALSGTSKSELLKTFLKYKLGPALFLAGIPGDIGGGVAMNAGVGEMITPREFVEITDWIDVLRPNGEIVRLQKDQLKWDYRHCSGWQPGIILKVGLSYPLNPDPTILDQVKQANKIRLSKQPLDMPSCGSVFVNPPAETGYKAAQLIDSSGLKGFTIGRAQVSMKHANFIVNTGGATAKQIWQVITHVQQVVLEKTGVQLKTEVLRLGEWK